MGEYGTFSRAGGSIQYAFSSVTVFELRILTAHSTLNITAATWEQASPRPAVAVGCEDFPSFLTYHPHMEGECHSFSVNVLPTEKVKENHENLIRIKYKTFDGKWYAGTPSLIKM